MIKVSALMFAAAARFVSTDECRYYLTGVHVEPCHLGGALMVGTDGHRLFCIHDKDGVCTAPVIISLSAPLLDALAPETADEDETRSRIVNRMLEISDAGIAEIVGVLRQLDDCRIDGTFPDWRKVFPKMTDAPRAAASFNGKYLGDFGAVADMLGDRSNRIRHVSPSDPMTPTLILFPASPHAFGVLMPTRDDDALRDVPEFAKAPKIKAAAE